MGNRLTHETSPYLRQHSNQPVDWFPWGEEAFAKAQKENKPVFLSIGYSTCHWCHVMANESFENQRIADLINSYFIPVKVDKEERPDIDSIYMRACQAFTGSGGWPMTVFLTPDQKPFFAGSYFPPKRRYGMIGLDELLLLIHKNWKNGREEMTDQAEKVLAHLDEKTEKDIPSPDGLPERAVQQFEKTYDRKNGGFGRAPKFPMPHQLMFLFSVYQKGGKESLLQMADHTLMQMYRGGIFDHVGGGFSRYSTDERYLIPHFEKMLYDNALMILAYCRACGHTEEGKKKLLYKKVAQRTAAYVLREMTDDEGGFYSAQDADSEGEEGKFYVFEKKEIEQVLGEKEADAFCAHYGITAQGNFEGKNILNLLESDPYDESFSPLLQKLYQYRQKRHSLHLDKKILTAWNGWMIGALCDLYLECKNEIYLRAAQDANAFIWKNLWDDRLYCSFSEGKKGTPGFLDDYAAFCFAQLSLYRVTLDEIYLEKAEMLCKTVREEFWDPREGGFYFSGEHNEKLVLRPKETYDGAIPSGNSLMEWNLVRLWNITGKEEYRLAAEEQLHFLSAEAEKYPAGHSLFLMAQLAYAHPPLKVTAVSDDDQLCRDIPFLFPMDASIIMKKPSKEYPLKNDRITFYVCCGRQCYPPVNDIGEILMQK